MITIQDDTQVNEQESFKVIYYAVYSQISPIV